MFHSGDQETLKEIPFKPMRLSTTLTICYAAVIFTVSAIPGYRIKTLPAPDYVMHFIEYAGFGFLLLWSFYESELSSGFKSALLLAAASGMVYGFYDELHQYFVPGRDASFHDLAADTAGSFAGACVSIIFFTLALRYSPYGNHVKSE